MTQGDSSPGRNLADQEPVGLFREMWEFLSVTKKWWLLPIIVVFGILGALIMLSGTAAAPFIYTLF